MARVFQDPDSKSWFLDYTDETGKRQRPVTPARNKTEANKLLGEVVQKIARVELGLDELLRDDMRYSALVTEYLGSLSKEYASAGHKAGYFENRILPYLGHKMCRSITAADIEQMMNGDKPVVLKYFVKGVPPRKDKAWTKIGLPNRELSPQSRDHLRLAVSASFSFMKKKEIIKRSPMEHVGKPSIPTREPRYLTLEQVKIAVTNVPKDWQCFFALVCVVGFRKTEGLALKKANVLLDEECVVIRETIQSDTTKGDADRRVPLKKWIIPILKKQMEKYPHSPLLFPNKNGLEFRSDHKLARMLKLALKRGGVVDGYTHVCRRKGCGYREDRNTVTPFPCPNKRGKGLCKFTTWPIGKPIDITFHDLRATWATHSYAAHGDLAFVQKMLGHKDIETTRRYVRQLMAVYQARANALPIENPFESPARILPNVVSNGVNRSQEK